MASVRLRVTVELLAVTAVNPRFVTLSEGSVIETSDDLADPGFHHVNFRGNDLLAFTRDIQERTVPSEIETV